MVRVKRPDWIPKAVWDKFDGSLQEEVVNAGGSRTVELTVVITIGSAEQRFHEDASVRPVDRDEAAAEIRAAFDSKAAPLLDTLAATGARDIEKLWLSSAIAACLPLSSLISVAGLPQVGYVVHNSPRDALL